MFFMYFFILTVFDFDNPVYIAKPEFSTIVYSQFYKIHTKNNFKIITWDVF